MDDATRELDDPMSDVVPEVVECNLTDLARLRWAGWRTDLPAFRLGRTDDLHRSEVYDDHS